MMSNIGADFDQTRSCFDVATYKSKKIGGEEHGEPTRSTAWPHAFLYKETCFQPGVEAGGSRTGLVAANPVCIIDPVSIVMAVHQQLQEQRRVFLLSIWHAKRVEMG